MKIKFAPKGDYRPGQQLLLDAKVWIIESVAHTGNTLIAHTPAKATKFERIQVILTNQPIKWEST